MPWYTIAAIYFIVWWLTFFAVLPWGVHSQEETADVVLGTDPGAPAVPALKKKALWTTVVSAIILSVFYWAFMTKVIRLEDLVTMWGLLR